MSQFETALAAYQSFTDSFQSLMISTVSTDNTPNASYAPFVIDKSKNIYIYVSGLSTHTQNLHAVPKASVLFIDDESQTKQIFARRRLTFDCTATLVERETELWKQIVDSFEARFGEMIQILRDLSDFRIFQLTPSKGRFVIGFGAAYEVDPNDLSTLTHVTGESKG
ncbi:HugZ family protein [Brasilonema octagenarum UFV-E1]|uniref:HugZ family protein n=2 Tax=Brasilonema TaxID=383614 RepID=A0A856MNJ9_9CYAN|nr:MULTISPECIES: pyridoxamine 5'-phosphate oxidase family protein [Brasilonema]NMF66547.1 HugZ family protein [Brasilonema octagenarum UFV-OR1]QDL10827.1 HugZ family protein [Brasilonema sennae CENA114]QDL17172.1 HugZ family protein [Brasilonema octagenarum UFV-E1]